MKKLFALALTFSIFSGLALSASAATTLDFPITVTFNATDIDLTVTGTPLATWGEVGPSRNYLSNGAAGEIRHTITQNGFLQVDFTASAVCTSGWILGSTIGSNTVANTCVVAGIFTEAVETGTPSRLLVAADFGNEDVLGSTPKVATTDVLARNNSLSDPDDSEELKGYKVPLVPGGFATRSARYLLQTPPSVSGAGADPQTITITIGAQASL